VVFDLISNKACAHLICIRPVTEGKIIERLHQRLLSLQPSLGLQTQMNFYPNPSGITPQKPF
jgi:hypothetical protein